MILIVLALALVAFELGLILTVRALRQEFQWLITEADELPVLDPQALRKFIEAAPRTSSLFPAAPARHSV